MSSNLFSSKAPAGAPSSGAAAREAKSSSPSNQFSAPAITLPKGGGALHGIGEKFSSNPVTGTGNISVPIATSSGRNGFGPQLSLSYDSGSGNGPFGFGWSLALPTISRKTDKGLPRYQDAQDSDVFLFSGAEDLVPLLRNDAFDVLDALGQPQVHEDDTEGWRVRRYLPRIEGVFARIERWSKINTPDDVHWRTLSKDNVLSIYGLNGNARIHDPQDASRIFTWLLCEMRDDKGNAIVYRYQAEDGVGVDLARAHQNNRGAGNATARGANRYLKHIFYGNRSSLLDAQAQRPRFLSQQQRDNAEWLFEVVLDYGDHQLAKPLPTPDLPWPSRADAFSRYRAGFEVRTARLCRRVLMFHHFVLEAAVGQNCLVKSTDFDYDGGGGGGGAQADQSASAVYQFLRSVSQVHYRRKLIDNLNGNLNNNGYQQRSLPPLEFFYSEVQIDGQVREIASTNLANLPQGVDGSQWQWQDLHGEGTPGILQRTGNAWYYQRNLSSMQPDGQVCFGALEPVARQPNAAGGRGQLMDLAGDGQTDLVLLDDAIPGFYPHDGAQGWQPFQAFAKRLNRDLRDPNLRFIDLDGDGHADVLITADDALLWHRSLGEQGFSDQQRVARMLDEEQGPRMVFADQSQSVYLADMSGDGLTELVRIKNGAVCYWPNLGYGRFGAKVTMDNAPWFDHAEQFEQKRIRLADIDGSGTADIIYLHSDGVRLYFNQSGNGWSAARLLAVFARVDDVVSIATADLLGNGTACLVWSSPLAGDARRQMRYVSLMGGQKPHLLIKSKNNLGQETEVVYAPSTKFYLQDQQAGRPWVGKLPFPVHCVEKITVTDQWRQSRFCSTFSYHHGYFDGVEREFRGFGRVEQIDSESFGQFAAGNSASPYITSDQTLYQPPIKTISWYHTGLYLGREKILSHYKEEYFPHSIAARPGPAQTDGVFAENALPEPELNDADWSAQEWREALRACKGRLLRQEVYELDVDALQSGQQLALRLVSSACHNCHIQRLQAQGNNRHAVFLVSESESISYQYELDLRAASAATPLQPDPRITHTLNLSQNEYGNVQQAVAVGYARVRNTLEASLAAKLDAAQQAQILAVQQEQHIAYTENHYTLDASDLENAAQPVGQHYRLRTVCEVQTYALTGIQPQSGHYFSLAQLRALALSTRYPAQVPVGASPLPVASLAYHILPAPAAANTPQKRLVEQVRTLFWQTDLSAPLPLGQLGVLGLTYQQYKLALNDALLDAVFTADDGYGPPGVLTCKLDLPLAGGSARSQLHNASRSGYLSGNALAQEFGALAQAQSPSAGQYWQRSGTIGFAPDARQHFFLPERYTDAFGNLTTVSFDGNYDLFVQSSTDARGNTSAITRFDYRLLAAAEMQDINGNLSQVAFDLLGMPCAAALKGKGNEGDNLDGLYGLDDLNVTLLDPAPDALIAFFTGDYDEAAARAWLAQASSRHLYYFGEGRDGDGKLVWGLHPPCAAGIVREKHVALLAAGEQSPLQAAFEYSDGAGNVLVKKMQAEAAPGAQDPTGLRWIASGKTILNNKGKPVKQYEPYFSANAQRFEEVQEVGVTPVLYYDAAGQLIRTEMPDGSISRVGYSPWYVAHFDANDTVQDVGNAWYARHTGAQATPAQLRAAQGAAVHAATPALSWLDSLGRDVIKIEHNRAQLPGQAQALEEKYLSFTKLDAEGKPLWIRDARQNLVMQYIYPPIAANQSADPLPVTAAPGGFVPCYDIAGNLLYQCGMDAGERWSLNDAAGKPMFGWEQNQSRDEQGTVTQEARVFATDYDALHRPVAQWLTVNGNMNGGINGGINDGASRMIERFVYLDAADNLPSAPAHNLHGQLVRHYDASGLNEVVALDFKGSPLHIRRTLALDYQASVIDWQGNPAAQLEGEVFAQITEYDALQRMTRLYNWHQDQGIGSRVAVYEPQYNRRGLLQSEALVLRASKTTSGYQESALSQRTAVIAALEYDVKGQRSRITHGNGTVTRYEYDPQTFRLIQLRTTRSGFTPDFPSASSALKDARVLQNLFYTYDAVGNISEIVDDALEPAFFQNQMVQARSEYLYDALYRLIFASGRENGAASGAPGRLEGVADSADFPKTAANALRNYSQTYTYDAVGNIAQMRHAAGPAGSWTRNYLTAPDSNQLLNSATGAALTAVDYQHDAHGNMLNLANVGAAALLQWDYRDMLQSFNGIGGGRTFYNYSASKQRTRKVNRNQAGTRKMWERIYLGGLELYRRYDAQGNLVEEIETVQVMDGQQRVVLVEDVLTTDSATLPTGALYRYQYSNHLGSSCLELDGAAQVLSYEEYHPFGTTAYQAAKGNAEASLKRYRYTGMERDEESGLNYHGARYYLPWLARWASCDPTGLADGPNIYQYGQNNPVMHIDTQGSEATPAGGNGGNGGIAGFTGNYQLQLKPFTLPSFSSLQPPPSLSLASPPPTRTVFPPILPTLGLLSLPLSALTPPGPIGPVAASANPVNPAVFTLFPKGKDKDSSAATFYPDVYTRGSNDPAIRGFTFRDNPSEADPELSEALPKAGLTTKYFSPLALFDPQQNYFARDPVTVADTIGKPVLITAMVLGLAGGIGLSSASAIAKPPDTKASLLSAANTPWGIGLGLLSGASPELFKNLGLEGISFGVKVNLAPEFGVHTPSDHSLPPSLTLPDPTFSLSLSFEIFGDGSGKFSPGLSNLGRKIGGFFGGIPGALSRAQNALTIDATKWDLSPPGTEYFRNVPF